MKFSEYFGAWIRAYYANVPLGRDFYTAVNASKFFGGAIAKYILENLERGNVRLPLNIIDLGGNNANLLNDIRAFLGAMGDGVVEECEFVLIDSRLETSASRLPLKDLANFGHSQTPSLASYQKFAKNSQIKPTNLGSRESGDSRKSCHFERSEKSNQSHGALASATAKSVVGGGGDRFSRGRGATSHFARSPAFKPPPPHPKMRAERISSENENGRNGESFGKDSRESNEILPTSNSKNCDEISSSHESKSFLPTFFQKSRWGLGQRPALSNTSPFPFLRGGVGGGVIPKNNEILQDSHKLSESKKIFRLTPQNDNNNSHESPQNKPICANIKAYPSLESFMRENANRHNIFIANELFDALPCEIIDNDKMAFVENNRLNFKPCNDKKILEICKEFNIIKGEIPLIYDEICECIKDIKFMFIAFDYGDIAPRNDFTVRLFRTHKIEQFLKIDDFSQLFGHCDITYNVPFFVLDKAFERIGAKKILLKRQDSALIEDFKILEIFSQFCKYKRESNCTSRTILHETNKLKTLLHNLSPKFWCAIYSNI